MSETDSATIDMADPEENELQYDKDYVVETTDGCDEPLELLQSEIFETQLENAGTVED